MIDIRFLRENPEAVKENIRKKFQDAKLPLVDEVVDLDAKRRAAIAEVESLKAARNKLSKANGPLFGQLKKCEDEAKKAELQAQIDRNNAAVKADDDRRAELDQSVSQMDARIREIMMDENVTVLFVTHTSATAKEFCSRGIVLDKGTKVYDGTIEDATAYYEANY